MRLFAHLTKLDFMKKCFISRCMVIVLLLWVFPLGASGIDTAKRYSTTIGEYFQVYHDEDTDSGVEGALKAFNNGRYAPARQSVINYGINPEPIWLALKVNHSEFAAAHRTLLFETAWLDRIEVYFFQRNRLINHYLLGDSQPFSQRPIDHRFFAINHPYQQGETLVLIRIASVDAVILPIYFMTDEQVTKHNTQQAYSYGLVYGVILALIAYNFMLFIGIKDYSYLFYSIYLFAFLILNIAYTGHGFQWLWPDHTVWQRWSNPFLIMLCSISGLIFALHFLNIKNIFPAIHRWVIGIATGFSALVLITYLMDDFATTLLISLTFIFIASFMMVILGIISLHDGNNFAKFFLLASICTICGGIITANTIWGLIPFSAWTYRAVEVGMMADAILLALALAEHFNISQNERLMAEKMAGTDALTNLNNRRSFYKYVKPIWSISLRNKSHTSVIMLDIDNFKSLNDNYGHAFGDQVLVSLAETLQKEARSGDTLARWGGEEFLIFLPETRLTDAINIAERMRRKVAQIQAITEQDIKLSFTASFGVAHTHDSNMSLDELISQADHQLYCAKKLGRNCVSAELSL